MAELANNKNFRQTLNKWDWGALIGLPPSAGILVTHSILYAKGGVLTVAKSIDMGKTLATANGIWDPQVGFSIFLNLKYHLEWECATHIIPQGKSSPQW